MIRDLEMRLSHGTLTLAIGRLGWQRLVYLRVRRPELHRLYVCCEPPPVSMLTDRYHASQSSSCRQQPFSILQRILGNQLLKRLYPFLWLDFLIGPASIDSLIGQISLEDLGWFLEVYSFGYPFP